MAHWPKIPCPEVSPTRSSRSHGPVASEALVGLAGKAPSAPRALTRRGSPLGSRRYVGQASGERVAERQQCQGRDGQADAETDGDVRRLPARHRTHLAGGRMPELDGLEATRRIVAANGSARILILTTFGLDEYVYEALRARGRAGSCSKTILPSSAHQRNHRQEGRHAHPPEARPSRPRTGRRARLPDLPHGDRRSPVTRCGIGWRRCPEGLTAKAA